MTENGDVAVTVTVPKVDLAILDWDAERRGVRVSRSTAIRCLVQTYCDMLVGDGVPVELEKAREEFYGRA